MHEIRVSTTYVTLLYEFLEQQGMDAQALLGPLPDEKRQPYTAVPEWNAMLSRSRDALGGEAFGLRVARCIAPRHFGIVGYMVLACASFGEALSRAERYASLVYDVSQLKLALENGCLIMRWGVENGRAGQLVDETGVAALVQLGRDMTNQNWSLTKVTFVNPEPADTKPYRAFFGCDVVFDHSFTELHFPLETLQQPLRQPDAGLLAVLDRQAEDLLAKMPGNEAAEQYRRVLLRLLREGRVSLDALAGEFHVSARTLQRKLSDEGLRFQTLYDGVRRMQAEEYLRDVRLPLADIAELLGYSERSAFNRAFRGWSGVSPARWRKQNA